LVHAQHQQPVWQRRPFAGGRLQRRPRHQGRQQGTQGNTLTGSITVTVAEVLPNGIIAVRGEKWMTLNTGEELVRIAGMVRADDIATDNTVPSTRVADARITYSGTGSFADASQPGWLDRFFISPLAFLSTDDHVQRQAADCSDPALSCFAAQAERLKDIASISGVRSNQLIGYGLVVGLNGTGDQTTQTPFTLQTFNNMLSQFGIKVPAGSGNVQLKNVAAVSVMPTASVRQAGPGGGHHRVVDR
jgi:hypothetical protein